ncbi:MAG: DUF503 domain-containing protein [Phycisphaerae bacterium]|nr:DUF503 domain-containing protein [Phycisphaerae bacterium]
MATIAGLVHLRLHVHQANSLKDKRRIVKSFKTRLSNAFNVSVAEVDGLDSHRTVVLAVAMVGNDKRYVEGSLQRIVNVAADERDMVLADHEIAWL